MKRFLVLASLVLVVSLLVGCTSGAGTSRTSFWSSINPNRNMTESLGSPDYYWEEAYIGTLNALSITGNVTEVDPVFTASPSFGITGAFIAAWNALVSSQWVDDVNGINYTGSVGIHTTSPATGLLVLYSSDGVSNDPVLEVADNSGSAESVGIRVKINGAKTDYTDGIYVTNSATTATAGAEKYGVRIKNTGNWVGAGSVNYGLYIEEPTGGATNVGAFIDGTMTMQSHQINDIVDPTLAQDAATKNYVDTNMTNEGARVYHNAAQTIANNTGTTLAFNSERYDTDVIHDTTTNNSRLTCKTAGKYLITVNLWWASSAVGDRSLCIKLNGTTHIAIVRNTGTIRGQVNTTIYDLAVNDYVEVIVLQTSGGVLDVQLESNFSPEFMMQRLGD